MKIDVKENEWERENDNEVIYWKKKGNIKELFKKKRKSGKEKIKKKKNETRHFRKIRNCWDLLTGGRMKNIVALLKKLKKKLKENEQS